MAGPPDPPPVGIHGVADGELASPASPATVRLRHVAAQPQVGQCDHRLIAVVALVGDHLGHAATGPQHRFDLLRRRDQHLDHRGRVARTGILHGDADDRARLHVDRVLSLVGQVRPAVLHLRDLRVRVLRMRPILVRALLPPLPVEARQLGAGRRRNAGRRRQSAQKRVVAFARIPAHDAPQRRVRLQRRRIDADRLPLEQAGVGYPLQHPGEDRLVRLDVDPAPRPPDRRVVGRGLRQRDVEELPQAQRIGRPPRHRPFRCQAFEVAEQQHPKVAARRQRRTADSVGVELRALRLDEGIEAGLVEHAVQSFVERVARGPCQVRVGHPHRRLPRASRALTHRHGNECRERDRGCRSLPARFTMMG